MRVNAQGLVCNSYRALSDTYTGSMVVRVALERTLAREQSALPILYCVRSCQWQPHLSVCGEHMGAGIFCGYAGIIMLRLIV